MRCTTIVLTCALSHRISRMGLALLSAAGIVFLSQAPVTAQPSGGDATPAYILHCLCATPQERNRIAADVRKLGGDVLYIYNELQGLAVTGPKGGKAEPFARQLQRIKGVIGVQPDSAASLYGNSSIEPNHIAVFPY